MHLTTV